MTKRKPRAKQRVALVRSEYQPSKAELEEAVEFPDDLTPDELATAVMQPVEIDWKDRPE